jgi:serpin B
MRGDIPVLTYPPIFETLEPRVLLSADALPQADWADVQQLVAGNNAFAFDLYETLRGGEGSLFFSPMSISSALAMTYAGADGETAEQMADVLHFTLPEERLHAAFGTLMRNLASSGDDSAACLGASGDPFTLSIANSLWGQVNYEFLSGFLQTLAENYDSPLRQLQFVGDPEGSRETINGWVSDETRGRIEDLLKRGDINVLTRLVLVNAIYFNASWSNPFSEWATRPDAFHLPGGDFQVDMMRQTQRFGYAEGEDYQAVELPYTGGDASMVILLPKEGRFQAFEQSLSAETMDEILADLSSTRVQLTMPKFECGAEVELARVLENMGMPDAFDECIADFSGMNGERPPDREALHIHKVRHKAWIEVDEAGTEAAAATAVVMDMMTSAVGGFLPPPVIFTADRPFIYTIRDTRTNSTLFMGRISDASVLEEADEEAREYPVLHFPPVDLKPIGPLPTPRNVPEALIVEPTLDAVSSSRWPAEVQLSVAGRETTLAVSNPDALMGEATLPLPPVTAEVPVATVRPTIAGTGLEADREGPLDTWSPLGDVAAGEPAAEPDLDLGTLALEPLDVLASDALTPALSR